MRKIYNKNEVTNNLKKSNFKLTLVTYTFNKNKITCLFQL